MEETIREERKLRFQQNIGNVKLRLAHCYGYTQATIDAAVADKSLLMAWHSSCSGNLPPRPSQELLEGCQRHAARLFTERIQQEL